MNNGAFGAPFFMEQLIEAKTVARELAPARLRSNRKKARAAVPPSGSKLPRHERLGFYSNSIATTSIATSPAGRFHTTSSPT
ncbi:hypothetical protein ACJ6X8_28770, partial [Pseudomonas alvandae]